MWTPRKSIKRNIKDEGSERNLEIIGILTLLLTYFKEDSEALF